MVKYFNGRQIPKDIFSKKQSIFDKFFVENEMVNISLAYHVNAALELASGRGAGPGAQTWDQEITHECGYQCCGAGVACSRHFEGGSGADYFGQSETRAAFLRWLWLDF